YNTTGHPLANVNNPYYLADTLDGDTLYFPITVKNDDARDPYGCAVTDTVAVTIYRGHHISGYISYNGFWHPSDKGITRPEVLATPDVTVYDADAGGGVGRDGEHMAVGNVKLNLYEYETHRWIDSTTSDADGLFAFNQLAPTNRYYIVGSSPQKTATVGANGVTANDATWVQQYAVGAKTAPVNPLSMWWYGANVDLSLTPAFTLGITSNDATYIQQRAVGASVHFKENLVNELEDWAHSNDTFMLDNDTLLHVRSIMRGDANRDYKDNPLNSQLTKAGGLRRFDTYNSIEVEDQMRLIDYPILSVSEGNILAFQLFMPYDASEVEVLGITSPVSEAHVVYNFIDDELLFNWIRPSAVEVHAGDTLAMLKIYLKHKPTSRIDRYFRLNPIGYEVTLSDLKIDPSWEIALPEIALFYYEESNDRDSLGYNIDSVGYIPTGAGDDKEVMLKQQGGETDQSEILSVIPNPMKTWADITYSVYGDCVVSLKLYTLLGEEVMVIVNSERQTGLYRRNITSSGLSSGVYVLRLETIRDNYMETDVVKVVVQK
ncbi:MAG: T9SS type A sorting domain-containing protein, partial [Bacteroidales bacterium]|nr:T9SS type A sorting domain-containing protein [Bacteroidales bacterium]